MIQGPFHSSCVALQYKTGTKFFHQAVPELHGIKNQKISVQLRGILHVFSKFVQCLMTYPVSAKEGSALQVSREQTSLFKWLVSFYIQTFKNESGWNCLV